MPRQNRFFNDKSFVAQMFDESFVVKLSGDSSTCWQIVVGVDSTHWQTFN